MAKRSFVFGCFVGSALMAIALLGARVHAPSSVEQATVQHAGRTRLALGAAAEPATPRDTLPARAAPADDGGQRCPMTGKTGRSTLSLEDVMNRVHGDTGGGCPYARRPAGDAQCPHLQDQEVSERQAGAIWL